MARSVEQFQTIHTEGAILPPDVLQRIAAGELEGLDAATYHLPSGTKTKEAISQSWTRLLRYWKDFQAARKLILDSDETGTLATREKWLLPLFQELGYGRLTTSKAPEIDGKLFPIERFWQHIPIHLIGCKLQLDHRTKGARGAATAIPHSMVQEFLNRSAEHAWAFLTNGLQLRLLRDSAALSRQSYVEFDLESMMDGEVYADFAVLWLVCHQSRLEGDKPEDFWLEKWSKLAQEQGTRILEDLRIGVQKAIESLGRGFISHSRNDALIARLQSGSLSTQDYYRQILRMVYRLLFLFVAEDRGLLHPHPPSDDMLRSEYDESCGRYDRFYSLRRLRDLAESYRGSKHSDLWHTLSLLFDSLGQPEGCPQLAIPAFGSFLWSRSAAPDLSGPAQLSASSSHAPAFIRNEDLLDAIRALAFVERNRVLRAVNYRNLGSVELGSVYESLLELHPQINIPGRSFSLNIAAGNERKTTGSFYTPDSLVQSLLDSALEPVVAEAIKGKTGIEATKAILNLKVCDAAVGSGHFLIGAAHRLARHLARARTGESEPSPQDYQHALRDVIGHCLYGVDLNPMAVELCKISLWMEALEPGKPLGFLDHRIVVGNSLLGTTPALLSRGIPDATFDPIEGDDKKYCAEWKKTNKRERKDYQSGQGEIFKQPWEQLGNLAVSLIQLDALPDDSVTDIRTKEQRYADLVKSSAYEYGRLLADAWCAAFVWKKTREFDYPITEKVFRDIERNPHSSPPWMKQEIVRLRDQFQFFHWHLAFPDVFIPATLIKETDIVGWTGGFNAVLGNPPWDQVQIDSQEFFSVKAPDLANTLRRDRRDTAITLLRQFEPDLVAAYQDAKRAIAATQHFVHNSSRYPLGSVGRLNSAPLFLESSVTISDAGGYTGLIVPTGIATDSFTQHLFGDLMNRGRLRSLYDFENEEFLFENVHHAMRFCLITVGPERSRKSPAEFLFFARQTEELTDDDRRFFLNSADLRLLNPTTGTCPALRFRRDVSLLRSISSRVPILVNEATALNPWGFGGFLMFMMDSGESVFYEELALSANGFVRTSAGWKRDVEDALPLMEGKMIHQFDHRFGTYAGQSPAQARQGKLPESTVLQHADPDFVTTPRYWVPASVIEARLGSRWDRKWYLAWRDITNAKNERTVIASILPACAAGDTLPLAFISVENISQVGALLGNFCSFILDYAARQKVSGMHLRFNQFYQLPVLPPTAYDTKALTPGERIGEWIHRRVFELVYTSRDLQAFARDYGYDGPPFTWDEARRLQIRCELDAAYFHLYGVVRDDVEYIMETFPIVKRKDIDKHGSYRTKETILEIYDQMAESQVIQSERVWHVIFVLVGAWKKKALAVGRPALEAGLLLMFKDELRKTLLGVPASQPSVQGSSQQDSPLRGLDYFIAEGDKRHWLKVTQSEFQQTIEAGDSFPQLSISPDDLTRAAETMTVIDRIARKEVELPSTGIQRVELSNKPVSPTSAVGA